MFLVRKANLGHGRIRWSYAAAGNHTLRGAQIAAWLDTSDFTLAPVLDITDEGTQEFLRNYMTELHAFIVRVLTVLPRNA